MIRRPPRSTLFPTRRSSDLEFDGRVDRIVSIGAFEHFRHERHKERSEEHTSELQSRFDLVCRLLLEKKNFIVLLLQILEQTIKTTFAYTNSIRIYSLLYPIR